MKNKAIALVGVPRSGTSLGMLVLIPMLGEHRLVGSKFMGRDEQKSMQGAIPKLSPIQEYNREKQKSKRQFVRPLPDKTKDFESMKDMNPEGFNECQFTVKGMTWSNQTADIFKKMDSMNEEPFMKLVCSGIANTDPSMISKIVYILREPHEVAKSQEKLKGRELPEGEVIHSPDFFIKSTMMFCIWRVQHGKDIPLIMIDHKDILGDAENTVKKIADFNGVPHNNAWEVVRQDLHRSKKEPIAHPQWEDAEKIYELMGRSDFQGVLDYMNSPKRMTHKVNADFQCHRVGRKVNLAHCQNCKANSSVVANSIIKSETDKIDWLNEPCALDCGALEKEGAISVEESIRNHTWVNESVGVGDAIEKLIGLVGVDKLFGSCGGCKKRKEKLNKMFMKERQW